MRSLRPTAGVVALAAALTVTLDATGRAPTPDNTTQPGWVWLFEGVAVLAPTAVGLAIVWRRPTNRVGWIMVVGGFLAGAWTSLVPDQGWSLQVGRAVWPLLFAWPIAVALVFPDGTLLTRRWRWVAGLGAVSFAGFIAVALLDNGAFDAPDAGVPNPMRNLTVPGWLSWIWIPFWLGILATLVAGAAAVVLRFRRSHGVERLQIKWLVWAVALVPLGLVLGVLSTTLLGLGTAAFAFLLFGQTAVAAAVGVAVERYRLYAIDRLINRTLVYAILTLVLAATFGAVTLGAGVALGRGSAWATAIATLVAAVAFRPLRSRIQAAVDRRFARQRYEGLRSVRSFEEKVREGNAEPEEIGAVVATALDDPLAEILFWLPETAAFAASDGTVVEALPDDGRSRSEITREGSRTAVLLHDPTLLERPELLRGILGAATLSIEIARLRVEVRRQNAEVQASRARILEAGYEERRRLERDLHDGAQQRLVSLGLQIRRMQRTLPPEARILGPALDGIVDDVGSAIADLRQISAGVRPTRLDNGLAAALHDLARTAPIAVEVRAPIERVPAGVEAAAYFIACEALTNAVKHASASKVSLTALQDDGTLRLSVEDDGVGGALARRGSGLAGMRERVAAYGGTLRLTSPHGGGTTIEVAIPCGS
jgi:signal transduction histidine kinase